jgi:hypothetical protein
MNNNNNNLILSIVLQVVSCLVLFVFILRLARFHDGAGKRFIHVGPSASGIDIDIIGVQINTWKRWYTLMTVLILLEAVNTYTFKTYKTWYRQNVVVDGDPGMDRRVSILLITIWRLATFIPHTFKWLTVIATQQLQFLVPALLVRTVISNVMDYSTCTN